ncbi:hypothetical protein ACFYXS_00545 [Streptomyces sp. NPDC002574]|uniref:hypothetical protein n=1 Tax=Streptomyces sp. NPDC002574 TaxID=3364652 RepID=UPI0036A66764
MITEYGVKTGPKRQRPWDVVASVALRTLLGLAVWTVATLALWRFVEGPVRTLTTGVELFAGAPLVGLYIAGPPRRRVGCAAALLTVVAMAALGMAVQGWLFPTMRNVGFQVGAIIGVPVAAALFVVIAGRAKAT